MENHNSSVALYKTSALNQVEIPLPSSKSETNRALIINALSGNKSTLHNISEARDSQTMQRLLQSEETVLDVIDAGTTMRFLTAYLAIQNENKILTGTPRMCERPIKILVDALVSIGADITYEKNEGFPPINIKGLKNQKTNTVQIRGDVSSQYISAMLMIAPRLPQGLTVELTGKVGSRPYIEMTLDLMATFGIKYTWNNNKIHIENQDYKAITYSIESDWSGASYWYSLVSLAEKADIKLLGLKKNSLQGDIRIVDIMSQLGVKTVFDEKGAHLTKSNSYGNLNFDFTDCPDLAQTVAVACAVKKVKCIMTGLESLRIKETDRILALQNELGKIGAKLVEENNTWTLLPADSFDYNKTNLIFESYDDHRMAMAFAPICTHADITIQHPDVVKKSYPGFWKDLGKAGIRLV